MPACTSRDQKTTLQWLGLRSSDCDWNTPDEQRCRGDDHNADVNSLLHYLPNVPDHLPRTSGAADAGSVATKQPTCQRVGVRCIGSLGIIFCKFSFLNLYDLKALTIPPQYGVAEPVGICAP